MPSTILRCRLHCVGFLVVPEFEPATLDEIFLDPRRLPLLLGCTLGCRSFRWVGPMHFGGAKNCMFGCWSEQVRFDQVNDWKMAPPRPRWKLPSTPSMLTMVCSLRGRRPPRMPRWRLRSQRFAVPAFLFTRCSRPSADAWCSAGTSTAKLAGFYRELGDYGEFDWRPTGCSARRLSPPTMWRRSLAT